MVRIQRRYILICFDIFRGNCNGYGRRDGNNSNDAPIYEIFATNRVYLMQRNESVDVQVGAEYRRLQKLDDGDRLYF
jgi:hypothetical protein